LSDLATHALIAVVGYVIYRDGPKLTTVSQATSAFKNNNLAPSTRYIYTVAAIDAAGNSSPQAHPAAATTSAKRDSQAPSTPRLKATAVSGVRSTFSWAPSSDNVAVVGYVMYRDGPKLTTVSQATTAFKNNNLAPSTRYIYTVAAIDAAGNSSPQSHPAAATTGPG
jgi:chitodextrinase